MAIHVVSLDMNNPSFVQLHVKLAPKDAKKLAKLAKGSKLSLSDAVRSMIRSTAAITAPAVAKEN